MFVPEYTIPMCNHDKFGFVLFMLFLTLSKFVSKIYKNYNYGKRKIY